MDKVIRIEREKPLHMYQPGEIGQPFQMEDTWFIGCPTCGGRNSLRNHTVCVNDDETITVHPSILCYGCKAEPCGAHYFIEKNCIKWV